MFQKINMKKKHFPLNPKGHGRLSNQKRGIRDSSGTNTWALRSRGEDQPPRHTSYLGLRPRGTVQSAVLITNGVQPRGNHSESHGSYLQALATGGPNSFGYTVFIRTGARGPGGAALAASARFPSEPHEQTEPLKDRTLNEPL